MKHSNAAVLLAVVAMVDVALPGQAPAFADAHRLLPFVEVAKLSAAGDVNGDGRTDAVFVGPPAQGSGFTSRVWLQTADARFVELADGFVEHSDRVTAIALLDVDGDGDLDIVAARAPSVGSGPPYGGAANDVYRNDGSGRFRLAPMGLPAVTTDVATCMAVGDLDNDGDQDILVGTTPQLWFTSGGSYGSWSSFGGLNRLLRNHGGQTWSLETLGSGSADVGAARAVALADFDGDGDLDAFVAQASGGDRYLRNSGGQLQAVDGAVPYEVDQETMAAAVDVDHDGDLDLVVVGLVVRVLLNDGTGMFSSNPSSVAQLQYPFPFGHARTADWDCDGWIDLVLVDLDRIWIARNVLGTFVVQPPILIPPGHLATNLTPPLMLDFEDDGDLDLVRSGQASIEPVLLRNDCGAGGFVTGQEFASWDPMSNIVVADFDSDGNLDVVGANVQQGHPRVFWRNDGSGRFDAIDGTSIGLGQEDSRALRAGDFDGDGDLDLVVASWYSGAKLYRNTQGVFSPVSIPSVYGRGAQFGDLDGDGDLDLYFIDSVRDVVLLNHGTWFGLGPAPVPMGGLTTWFTLVDLDGDGDLDVAAPDHLLQNDGTARFSAMSTQPPPGMGSVVAGDFDGDQDIDLIFGGLSLQRLRNVNGTFVLDSSGLPADQGVTGHLQASDFDHDGDLDLVQVGVETSTNPPGFATRILLNDGQGNFTPASAFANEVVYSQEMWLGDFDDDSDQDLLLMGAGVPRLFRNLEHQLTWRSLPRVGYPLTMSLRGRAGEPFALGLAMHADAIPIPGIGTLRLAPASLQVVFGGCYDPSGLAELMLHVPNSASLVGLVAYWQALSGTTPKLGNREITQLLAH